MSLAYHLNLKPFHPEIPPFGTSPKVFMCMYKIHAQRYCLFSLLFTIEKNTHHKGMTKPNKRRVNTIWQNIMKYCTGIQ